MSISSQITRISGNVSNALAAIANKGVTVPSGSDSDDLADLIGLISTDSTYTITKNLTSVTSSADDTKVIAGNSFFTELTPASGYYISSITVTMGGVDITEQVFKAGTGAKTITVNGTYAASADNLSGYTAVSVNVPSGSASLGTKSITSNGTYNASSDGYDGYSQVTVNVSGGSPSLQSKTNTYTPTTLTQTETVSADNGYDGLSSVGITVNPIPSQYIVPTGTKSITANGTNIDVTSYAAVDVAVPTGGVTVKTASGTFTGNGTREVSFTCSFEPDLVYWYTDTQGATYTGSIAGLIARGLMASSQYANNSTSKSQNVQTPITGMNDNGSSYNYKATYANNTVTLYCFTSNVRTLFKNNQVYSWQCIKYTA